jgi:hypothetical protein
MFRTTKSQDTPRHATPHAVLFVAAGLLLLTACGQEREKVSVDFVRALPSEQPFPIPSDAPWPVPKKLPSRRIGLQPTPAVTTPGIPNSQWDQARVRREEAAEKELRSLIRRLRRAFEEDSKRFEQEQLRALADELGTANLAFAGKLRALFEELAAKRGPLAEQLAVEMDFPDPDPGSSQAEQTIQSETADPYRKSVAKKVVDLRARIQALESDFNAKVDALLADIDAEVGRRTLEVRLAIAEYRARNDARAESAARAQLLAVRPVDKVFERQAPVTLPAAPAQSIVLPESTEIPPPPKVQPAESLVSVDARRRRLESRAKIWAAHVGVDLVSPGEGVRDATQEFLQWQKTALDGP